MANVFKYLNRILVINKTLRSKTNSRSLTTVLAETTEEDNLADKSSTVKNVQKILDVSSRTALKVVNENRKLMYTQPWLIRKNFETLLENDIKMSVILRYPHLLGITNLGNKIALLKNLSYPLNTTIVLAGLSETMISSISNRRILELAKLFEISHEKACEFIYKKTFLCTKDMEFLKENMKIVRDCGVSIEDVQKDPWILRYSHDVIRERIEYIKMREVKPLTLKPWMLRCPIEIIENHFRRRQDNKQILGSASLSEYLSERLECKKEEAEYLISKMPALTTKSLKTITDIINFLYSKGFKPHHICRVPKILVHSVVTTKKRLEQMENAGIQVDSLYMLTKSHKQFMQIFEAMVKMKKSNNNPTVDKK